MSAAPQLLSPYTAVIFDMDGVIINSEPLHEKAQKRVFDQYQIYVPVDDFKTFKGMTEEVVFQYVTDRYAPPVTDVQELIAAKHAAYNRLFGELELIPGVYTLLQQLTDACIPLGLATSATRQNQQRTFQQFGLEHFFKVVVTAADVVHPKPDPEAYRTMIRRLGMSPDTCIVIEDSLYGVQAAVRAGCHVIGICTTFHTCELAQAGSHRTFDTMGQIARYLPPQDTVAPGVMHWCH